MIAQGDDLENALPGEEHDKNKVDQEQNIFYLLTLVIRLHHHGHHIQADQHHNEDVKELLGDQVVYQALEAVLQTSDISRQHMGEEHTEEEKMQLVL